MPRVSEASLPQPPAEVRGSFSLYLLAGIVAVVNTVVQLALGQTKLVALAGSAGMLALFLVLGSYMRAGRLWARMTLMSLSFVLVAVHLLWFLSLVVALRQGQGGPAGPILPTLGYVAVEALLISAATVLMYRPGTHGYFR